MTVERDLAAAPAASAATIGLAVGAGIGAAIAGAMLWAVVTVLSNFELGIMAVAVGYLVGHAIILAVKRGDHTFGIIGAACSLFGCLLGNLLSAVGFASEAMHEGYFDVLARLSPHSAAALFGATFSAMDLLFYAIAIYEGYRFASRR